MGKGKRNHKNKKSKASKPAAPSGTGHSHSEPVTNPPQTPPPPPHSDSPMPSTEDKPPAGSIGIGIPTGNKLFETHPLPAEKGVSKAEESIEGEDNNLNDTDNNLNEKMPAKTGNGNEQIHDAIVVEGGTDNVPTSVEAEPPRTTGSGDIVNNGETEQDNQQKEEKEVGPEQTGVTEGKEGEESEKEEEEDQKSYTKTPRSTSPAHKQRRSRSGTSEETQELKHNHLHSEDIGPQHTQADRETRELRHIDLEGGEIGYNLGKGDNHDRGSEHHAPAEPIVHGPMSEVRSSVKEPSNEALAGEIAQNADKISAEVSSSGEGMAAAVNALEDRSTQGVEGDMVTYAQVAASEPPNGELVLGEEGSKEVQGPLEDSWATVAAEEVAPETKNSKDIDTKNEIGYNNTREPGHHNIRESVAKEAAEEGPSSEKLRDESKGIEEEPAPATDEERAKQVQSSVEVSSSKTSAEEATPETGELKDIGVKDEIGYNLGKGDGRDHGTQHHAPTEGASTEAVALETSSGADAVEISTHGQQNAAEEMPLGVAAEKVSSEIEELGVIDVDGEVGYNPGKGDDHDRGPAHHAPLEESLGGNTLDKAKRDVEDPSDEAPPVEAGLDTQQLKDIGANDDFEYNPGQVDIHVQAPDHAPAEEVSVEITTDKKAQENKGGSAHDQAADEMEEAFEELLVEDSAHEQEIPGGIKSADDQPAGEAVGEELAFGIAEVGDFDIANKPVELAREQRVDPVATQDEASLGQNDSPKYSPVEESKLENGLPHVNITSDDVSNNAYTENTSDTIKRQSEEGAKDTPLPKSTQFGMGTPERQEIRERDSLERLAPHPPLGLDSLAWELGESYHIPLSNDPSSRGDTSDTPLTYQEDFFSESLLDLTGDREVLEYECSIKIGDSRPEPNLISGTTVTLDQLQETISCFKREVLESLESRNLLVDTGDAQQNQDQKLTIDISQLGPRLGKMESDLDFIRKQISNINTSHPSGPSLLPQYSSKGDRASRSASPGPSVPERRISWSMISLSVVTALGLVALGSILGSVTKARGLTDKAAQWLFSEGKAAGK